MSKFKISIIYTHTHTCTHTHACTQHMHSHRVSAADEEVSTLLAISATQFQSLLKLFDLTTYNNVLWKNLEGWNIPFTPTLKTYGLVPSQKKLYASVQQQFINTIFTSLEPPIGYFQF
ncbi:Hypothetical predicted protein [Octopus vulgaris]|uniref:Uncharacterized protein n=1 Tax=Octopus vulgaris TaxID=6645 RepID=A0AA36BDK9_OCTVU|nr:Hypothetical predicted protein [Octopus vulgaris]